MGKSTAGDLLRERGFPVVDTDTIARQLVEPGSSALDQIKLAFGSAVIDSGGRLRRDVLAGIVFADPTARQKLEQILHPPIRKAWLHETDVWRRQGHRFGFVIIPLLFETNAAPAFDATICIACSTASQKVRLAARNWDETEIRRRVESQWPTQRKMDAADYVVWTETTLAMHGAQFGHIISSLSA